MNVDQSEPVFINGCWKVRPGANMICKWSHRMTDQHRQYNSVSTGLIREVTLQERQNRCCGESCRQWSHYLGYRCSIKSWSITNERIKIQNIVTSYQKSQTRVSKMLESSTRLSISILQQVTTVLKALRMAAIGLG